MTSSRNIAKIKEQQMDGTRAQARNPGGAGLGVQRYGTHVGKGNQARGGLIKPGGVTKGKSRDASGEREVTNNNDGRQDWAIKEK
jgi:hypothetical protein